MSLHHLKTKLASSSPSVVGLQFLLVRPRLTTENRSGFVSHRQLFPVLGSLCRETTRTEEQEEEGGNEEMKLRWKEGWTGKMEVEKEMEKWESVKKKEEEWRCRKKRSNHGEEVKMQRRRNITDFRDLMSLKEKISKKEANMEREEEENSEEDKWKETLNAESRQEQTNGLNEAHDEKRGKVMKPLGRRREGNLLQLCHPLQNKPWSYFHLLFPEILCGNEFNHFAPNFNLLL